MSSVFVIGAGATGVFLADRLARVAPVTLVGRVEGEVLLEDEARVARLAVKSWAGLPARLPAGSRVFLTTKVYQLREALQQLAPHLPTDAELILCQNGIGLLEETARWVPSARSTRLICWFGAWRPEPSRVRVTGVSGVDLAGKGGAALEISELLSRTGVPVLRHEDSVARAEWRKALLNVALNGLGSILRISNGEVLRDPGLREVVAGLIDESCAVAAAEGVDLSDEDRARVQAAGTGFAATNRNSMLQDLEAGRPTELPWLNGAVVKLGKKHGIATPMNEMVRALVTFLETKTK